MKLLNIPVLILQTLSAWMIMQGLWYWLLYGIKEGNAQSRRLWRRITFRTPDET